MREIRLHGSEGGGAARSPSPYQRAFAATTCISRNEDLNFRFRGNDKGAHKDGEKRSGATISRISIQFANLTKKEAQFLGQVAGEAHRLLGSRMEKLQKCSMKEVSFQSGQSLLPGRQGDSGRCAIECVANNGMFDRAQVYPNLMGSARLDRELEQREARKTFHHFVQRMRLASAAGSRGHAETVRTIAPDGALNFSGWLVHSAVYQSQISFGDRTRLKLACEIRVAEVVLGNHEQSGGLFIQAMYDSRTVRTAG